MRYTRTSNDEASDDITSLCSSSALDLSEDSKDSEDSEEDLLLCGSVHCPILVKNGQV